MPQTVVARLRPSAFRKIPWRRLCCGLSRTEILREQSNPNAQASIKCDLIRFFILGTRLNVLAGVVGFGRTGGCNRAANRQFYPDLFGEVLLVFEFFEGFDDVFALLGQNVRPGQEAIIECQFCTLDVFERIDRRPPAGFKLAGRSRLALASRIRFLSSVFSDSR